MTKPSGDPKGSLSEEPSIGGDPGVPADDDAHAVPADGGAADEAKAFAPPERAEEAAPAGSGAPPGGARPAAGSPPSAVATSYPPGSTPPSSMGDRRISSIESLLDQGDWAGVLKVLGPPETAENLPPTLALIYAVARKEASSAKSMPPKAPAGQQRLDDNALAMHAMASLLGVPPDSATALVFAKRVLRRNPVKPQRSSPRPRTSLVVVAFALVIGALVGWLIGPGSMRVP